MINANQPVAQGMCPQKYHVWVLLWFRVLQIVFMVKHVKVSVGQELIMNASGF